MKAKSPRRSTETIPSQSLSAVLLDATEAFVGSLRKDAEERKMYRDLAREYLPYTDISSRYQVAELLVGCSKAPTELLESLGRDADPDVSSLTLQYSEGLSEAYLLAAVDNGPQHRRDAISKRQDLPKSVLAALLSQQADATLTSFKAGPSVPQTNLTPQTADAPEEGKLLDAFLSQSDSERMASLQKFEAEAREADMFSPEGRITAGRLANADQRGLTLDVITRGVEGLSAFLQDHTSLSQNAVDKIIQDQSGYGLLVALKSLGLNRTFCGWILVHHLGRALSLDAVRRRLAYYDMFCPRAALLMIESWISAAAPQKRVKHHAMYMDTPGVRENVLGRLRRSRSRHGTEQPEKASAVH